MKRATFLVMLVGLLVIPCTGCNPPSPDTVQSISTGVLTLGLQVYSKNHADQTAKISTGMIQGADLALDYLDKNSGLDTSILNVAVFAKLTEGLSADYPEIVDLIESSAGILDQILPIPSPDQYLNALQLEYLKKFVISVKDAATNFNNKAEIKDLKLVQKAQKNLRPGKWLSRASVKAAK